MGTALRNCFVPALSSKREVRNSAQTEWSLILPGQVSGHGESPPSDEDTLVLPSRGDASLEEPSEIRRHSLGDSGPAESSCPASQQHSRLGNLSRWSAARSNGYSGLSLQVPWRSLATSSSSSGGYGRGRAAGEATPSAQKPVTSVDVDRLIALCMTQERPRALVQASAALLDAAIQKLGAEPADADTRSKKIRTMLKLTDDLRRENANIAEQGVTVPAAEAEETTPAEDVNVTERVGR